MESKNPLRHILALVIAIIPLMYVALQWNTVPETVAVHFDIHGQADDYGSKKEMLLMAVFLSVTSLITYLVVINAHKFDKKRTKGVKPVMFDTIALATVLFISILNLTIIINSIYPGVVLLDKVVIPVIGLFFIFMGNVMYNIKPNRFVGIRVPWTLNNDENWKHTHRLGSKLFFVGGILITLVSLGYEVEVSTIFMTGVVLIITITTVLYSYLYHRKSQNNNA